MKKTTKAAAKPVAPKAVKPKAKTASQRPVTAAVPARASKSATIITARYDVGFGNSLYIRGEGPGLSWDHGVLMNCISSDMWTYTIEGTERPVIFKFLVNDTEWCLGDDYVLAAGKEVVLEPAF